MSYEKITTTRYRLKCEATNKDGTICGYKWESDTIPDRCARCKKTTWNGRSPFRGSLLPYRGKSQTIRQWAIELGIKEPTIRQRIKRGWEIEDCLDTGTFMPGRKPKEVHHEQRA